MKKILVCIWQTCIDNPIQQNALLYTKWHEVSSNMGYLFQINRPDHFTHIHVMIDYYHHNLEGCILSYINQSHVFSNSVASYELVIGHCRSFAATELGD